VAVGGGLGGLGPPGGEPDITGVLRQAESEHILEIAEKFSDCVCILDHGGMRLSGRVEDLRQSGNAQSLEELFLKLSERSEEE